MGRKQKNFFGNQGGRAGQPKIKKWQSTPISEQCPCCDANPVFNKLFSLMYAVLKKAKRFYNQEEWFIYVKEDVQTEHYLSLCPGKRSLY